MTDANDEALDALVADLSRCICPIPEQCENARECDLDACVIRTITALRRERDEAKRLLESALTQDLEEVIADNGGTLGQLLEHEAKTRLGLRIADSEGGDDETP